MQPLLAWLLCAALSGGAASAQVADAAAAAADATFRQVPGWWQQTLDQGDMNRVLSSYDVIERLIGDSGDVDPAACTAEANALEQSMRDNPVGFGVWWYAYLCAEALGDADAADQRMLVLSALLRHAFEGLPPDHGRTPIRVLSEIDMVAIVAASGGELLYWYYDIFQLPGAMPMRVVVWDPTEKRERHLAMDFLDSLARMTRDPVARYPLFRTLLAPQLLKQLSGPDATSPAGNALALRDAMQRTTPKERFDAMAGLAQGTDVGSSINYGSLCLLHAEAGCAERAIDVLLPLAEQTLAEPLLLLAYAHAAGIGVKRDEKAAAALLDAAQQRLDGALLRFVATSCFTRQRDCLPRFARKRFAALVKSGDPMAAMFATLTTNDSRWTNQPEGEIRRGLARAAAVGLKTAQQMHGALLFQDGNEHEAALWLARAAQAGDADAAALLAKMHTDGRGVARDFDRAERLFASAANLGHTESMWWLALREDQRLNAPGAASLQPAASGVTTGLEPLLPSFFMAQQLRESKQWWLQSAAALSHVPSSLALAQLYRDGGAGVEGGPRQAEAIYEFLSASKDSAQARRELAKMRKVTEGRAADVAQARRLLAADAHSGDAASQFLLAQALLASDDRSADREAREWLERAAAHNEPGAAGELALMLIAGQGGAADPERALALWRAAPVEDTLAINNLAWFQCISRDPRVFDAGAGLATARRLQSPGMPSTYRDTLAACLAANGEFSAAITQQEQVVAQHLAALPVSEASLRAARERLDLYRSGARYLPPEHH